MSKSVYPSKSVDNSFIYQVGLRVYRRVGTSVPQLLIRRLDGGGSDTPLGTEGTWGCTTHTKNVGPRLQKRPVHLAQLKL